MLLSHMLHIMHRFAPHIIFIVTQQNITACKQAMKFWKYETTILSGAQTIQCDPNKQLNVIWLDKLGLLDMDTKKHMLRTLSTSIVIRVLRPIYFHLLPTKYYLRLNMLGECLILHKQHHMLLNQFVILLLVVLRLFLKLVDVEEQEEINKTTR
jgi:hypothetical protein